ncbi:DUF2510 domain-containing protein [Streptomyces sp. PU-14G]|uniref:DUF2510 domain-containing protein n=1 Tax=Streptomyces sp. PU-14G TaxID=2800808 RepID=UPI0034DED9E5
MTTPPGWYPEPGQTPQLPPRERWWDGHNWTAQTRQATGTPSARGGGRAGRGPLIGLVAGIVGAVVLAAALALGSVLLLGGDPDEGGATEAGPGVPSPAPEGSTPGDKGESAPPRDDEPPSKIPEVARDPLLGVGLTAPEGWERASDSHAAVSSEHEYTCPASRKEECVRGGGVLKATNGAGSDKGALKELTEAQVAENAKTSYPKKSYGGITGHQVVESGAVTVAGEPGYRVRWRVANKLKPDAYVEAVVFRSPESSQRTLALWSSVDIADDAPPASDLDALRNGVVATGAGEDEGPREAV